MFRERGKRCPVTAVVCRPQCEADKNSLWPTEGCKAQLLTLPRRGHLLIPIRYRSEPLHGAWIQPSFKTTHYLIILRQKKTCFCLPPFIDLVMRPAHHQQPRKDMNEDASNPWCHSVRLWRTEMNVQHNNRHTYAAGKKKEIYSITVASLGWFSM